MRTRDCDNPPAQNGGRDCQGSSTEEQQCNPKLCMGIGIITKSEAAAECAKLGRYLPAPRSSSDNEEMLQFTNQRYFLIVCTICQSLYMCK